ncbi:DivIVA domain-containing protein [Bdellovibrio bacteriovorus]|uniref:DivIVA domain-containing protein n=1 Tax=Bdellovibrio bacteriovorus TaxID=959 RepID=UPI0022B766C1|nr:DivIVA domain-containing protein [Bdellovibrio bacteriovorus]
MRITPIDIAHKSFGKKMMGLDADEVMDFLQQIAAQMESLIQERNTFRNETP